MMVQKQINILVVDDEDSIRAVLTNVLEDDGFAVTEADRPNAVRIAECDEPVSEDHNDDGISAVASAVDATDGYRQVVFGRL